MYIGVISVPSSRFPPSRVLKKIVEVIPGWQQTCLYHEKAIKIRNNGQGKNRFFNSFIFSQKN